MQTSDERCVLGIDASSYGLRAAVAGEDESLIDAMEARPAHTETLIRFIHRNQQKYPALRLIGSPLDQWPAGLHAALKDAYVSWDWLMPNPTRSVLWHLAPWQKKRRLQRARLLAYLARHQGEIEKSEQATRIAIGWEFFVNQEAANEARLAAQAHGTDVNFIPF